MIKGNLDGKMKGIVSWGYSWAGLQCCLPEQTTTYYLAIYILMQATVLASPCGIKSSRFGYCKPLTWKHGDIFFMCQSFMQILFEARKLDLLRHTSHPSISMGQSGVQERDVFRSKYMNVLDWAFSVPPPPDETPRRKTSRFTSGKLLPGTTNLYISYSIRNAVA
ncbi:hypothetical protein MLD38_024654 [Melastoma candidum]|uniref:Uncharacterized protein n=1 Tax=Melastoma candidum TaxID=119954 RepID=A0ACB9NUP1_9MYRT|nr:hypothetical protein MLD38_024654 [Melastoma candidum]